jgi:membrane associated rhomboid family serine protease
MEENIEAIALLIVIITTIISYHGFKNLTFFDKYAFEVDPILINKEYIRMLSSGFLHANWLHLLFNMAVLYSFSYGVGYILGIKYFLLLYFVSLVAGNLLALFIHRNHGDYSAIGASGAVSGVIFSSIVMFPESAISFPFLPFSIQSWVFGVGYLLFSIYGIKAQFGNIGHEAHLGGAIAGIITSVCIEPKLLELHPLVVAVLLLPIILFLVLLVYKPEILLIEHYWGYQRNAITHQQLYAESDDEEMLNLLLEKVNEKGINSLTRKEKQKLEELSRSLKS